MTRLLIIGSLGFIGRHVHHYFSKDGSFTVFACDVLPNYGAENYFPVDAANADFQELFQQQSFDFCINCSGAASVGDSIVHPLRDFSLNTFNVVKILEAIRKNSPACRFVNMSSAAVYGNPRQLPIAEADAPGPISPYGFHKWQAEQICTEYHRFFHIASCSLRIFSAYGPGLKKQLFWDLFQKAKISNKEIQLWGTGEESRDFIYVKDICAAVNAVLRNSRFCGEVVNVASGRETTIREAASAFLAGLGWKGRLEFGQQRREGDPVNWRADITKLTSMGFSPEYSLTAGLKKYIEWLGEEKLD